ncbi:unnamed protein product [Prorocentrum cordatum]|uniref:Decapping nuclease n=1 Tax=Prorocentrum cordatum TaxID=2364126 RepID=A0ABN9TD25_9DINO|nr:unnamed protein product [Polarella glacialis]
MHFEGMRVSVCTWPSRRPHERFGPGHIQGNLVVRCQCCRRCVAVDYQNPLFELLGGNRTSVTDQTLCFFNCVEGAGVTYSMRHTGLGETAVSALYRKVRHIMAWDAVREQGALVFGVKPDGRTTEVESDAHVFFSWTEPGTEADKDEDGIIPVRIHYFYVWIGVMERGNLRNSHFREVGITKARNCGDGGPPLQRTRNTGGPYVMRCSTRAPTW